jgi:hypothetical protein
MSAQPVSDENATEPAITERDMLGALEVLATAADDPDELLVLTDEELLGLGGPSALDLLGSPYLSQPEVDADASAAAAVRSLAARRLLTPADDSAQPEGDIVVGNAESTRRPFQLDRRLAGVLALRRTSLGLVNVVRTLAGGTTTLAIYCFPGGGVLEEYVTIDGFHHFSVPEPSAVAFRLGRFVDPFDDASDDGDVATVRVPGQDVDAAVDGSRAISILTSVVEGGGTQATFIAHPGRLRIIDNGPIREDSDPVDREISDVSPESLVSILQSLVPVPPDDDEQDQAPEASRD